ncbi:glycosyl transferase, group 2 family protein [Synechococcus sp. PCC 7335]|uniref:glycosyltransferase n=1 Tax=Synechococcus sp. (strain ATCC 29403 / PCC 7335) TaxID=91464 RepID=UPI00017ED999|nr:glycosyltransferase family A protein [Synechococcus sp. PCC 7335]EDX87592.1 glycosyl transferase, group 2 family protein [Synechococcus sp. PCC 7335]
MTNSIESTAVSTAFVSVIIPVYNDPHRLQTCLQALDNQTYPKSHYEVIVVDNASTESPAQIVAPYEWASLMVEREPGSYAARNTGIKQAKGPIIAFTDADCIPDTDWLRAGVSCLESTEGCGMVAGRIDLFFQDLEKPTAVEIYESVEMGFSQAEFLAEQHYGLTANLFTYKQVIEDVGLFSTTLKSGGDKEWGQRVFAANYPQVYAHDAYVCHPTRHSFGALYKRVTRIVGGKHDAAQSQWSHLDNAKGFAKDLVMAFTPPGRSILRVWDNKKLQTQKQRFQFVFVMFFVRYVSAWERMRLRLGGRSRRW